MSNSETTLLVRKHKLDLASRLTGTVAEAAALLETERQREQDLPGRFQIYRGILVVGAATGKPEGAPGICRQRHLQLEVKFSTNPFVVPRRYGLVEILIGYPVRIASVVIAELSLDTARQPPVPAGLECVSQVPVDDKIGNLYTLNILPFK